MFRYSISMDTGERKVPAAQFNFYRKGSCNPMLQLKSTKSSINQIDLICHNFLSIKKKLPNPRAVRTKSNTYAEQESKRRDDEHQIQKINVDMDVQRYLDYFTEHQPDIIMMITELQ